MLKYIAILFNSHLDLGNFQLKNFSAQNNCLPIWWTEMNLYSIARNLTQHHLSRPLCDIFLSPLQKYLSTLDTSWGNRPVIESHHNLFALKDIHKAKGYSEQYWLFDSHICIKFSTFFIFLLFHQFFTISKESFSFVFYCLTLH